MSRMELGSGGLKIRKKTNERHVFSIEQNVLEKESKDLCE